MEETIKQKLIKGEQLSEDELEYFCYNFGHEVHEEKSESQRWNTPITVVKEFLDSNNIKRLFECTYMKGNTECQENEFMDQPYEVRPETETITRTVYKKIAK